MTKKATPATKRQELGENSNTSSAQDHLTFLRALKSNGEITEEQLTELEELELNALDSGKDKDEEAPEFASDQVPSGQQFNTADVKALNREHGDRESKYELRNNIVYVKGKHYVKDELGTPVPQWFFDLVVATANEDTDAAEVTAKFFKKI